MSSLTENGHSLTDESSRISIADSVQNTIESASVVDRLSVPHHLLIFAATIIAFP